MNEFENGEVVKFELKEKRLDCIINVGYENDLTLEKSYYDGYIVWTNKTIYYKVVNDLGETKYYPANTFCSVRVF